MTFKSDLKLLKDAGFAIPLGYGDGYATKLSQFRDAFDNGDFRLVKEAASADAWDYGPDTFGFETTTSAYSCGVNNLGDFQLPPKEEKVSAEVMAALMRIALLRNKKQKYMQATTLTLKPWATLNKAMPLAGFKEVVRVPTRHGKYSIIIWENIQ